MTKKRIVTISISTVLGILLIGVVIGWWVYRAPQTNLKQAILSHSPLPIARVGGKPIFMSTLADRRALAQKVHAQNSGSTMPSDQQLLQTIIDERKVESLVKNNHLTVSNDDLDHEYKNLLAQSGTDASSFAQTIHTNYGMSESEFKNSVMRAAVNKAKLTIWYNNQRTLNAATYQLLDSINQQLQNGSDFGALAKQYSLDDATNQFQGDLGWKTADQLLPEIAQALQTIGNGQTVVASSRNGNHIIKLVDKQTDNNSIERWHVQHIFRPTLGFDAWLKQQLLTINSSTYINY